jgi:hypothetical protein
MAASAFAIEVREDVPLPVSEGVWRVGPYGQHTVCDSVVGEWDGTQRLVPFRETATTPVAGRSVCDQRVRDPHLVASPGVDRGVWVGRLVCCCQV